MALRRVQQRVASVQSRVRGVGLTHGTGGGSPLAPFDQLNGDWPGGDLAPRRNIWQYTEDVASNRYSAATLTKQTDTYIVSVNGAPVVLTRTTSSNFFSALRSNIGGLGLAPFTIGARYLVSCFVYTPDAAEGFIWQRTLVNGGSQGMGARFIANRPRRIWTLMQATTTTALDPGPTAATDLGATTGDNPQWLFRANAPGLPSTTEIYIGGFQIERVADGYDDGIAALGSSIYQVDSGTTDAQASTSPLRWLEGLLNVTVFNRGVAGNNAGQMLARYDADVHPVAQRCKYGLFEVCNPNDVSNANPFTLQQIKDNAFAIRDKFLADGLIPVVTLCTPFGQTGSQETKRLDVNAWAPTAFPNVIDWATPLTDPSNPNSMRPEYLVGNTVGDSTHPNTSARRQQGIILGSAPVWSFTRPTPYQKITAATYP